MITSAGRRLDHGHKHTQRREAAVVVCGVSATGVQRQVEGKMWWREWQQSS